MPTGQQTATCTGYTGYQYVRHGESGARRLRGGYLNTGAKVRDDNYRYKQAIVEEKTM